MKHSDLKPQNRRNRLAIRCLALMIGLSTFAALAFPNYGVLPKVSAGSDTAMPTAVPTEPPIALFDFEGGTEPENKSGNGVPATFENHGSENIIGTDDGSNHFLDLTNSQAYLSLPGSILNGLTEMTIEMKVKTTDNSAPNWAFYAAADGNSPSENNEHYLGILLKKDSLTENNVKVERYANSVSRPINPTAEWTADKWQTIRVVFKTSSTILCVDDKVVELGTPYSLSKCIGEDGVIWFGHAPWGIGEGFTGCIDDITIWDHAIYDPINEEEHIVTDRVTDPRYTTVNMFDYWIETQDSNDYEALNGNQHNTLLQGINYDHLFLFAGETAFSGPQATEAEIGFWNRSRGLDDDSAENMALRNTITQGIVKGNLGEDGYPVLALDSLVSSGYTLSNATLDGLLQDNGKRTESLAYLFEPSDGAYKKAYPNVTGLFRINENGYYEFRSWSTFAELNVEQETGQNHITLYDTIWGWGLPHENDGQFFPFNDWSKMFFADQSRGLVQAHKNYQDINGNWVDGGVGQTTTDEPLNHYFGMTVETEFQQPTDGMLDRGTTKEAMKFEFSGDDDIWIFIDDVLVGDLGGIHGWKTISIDFSTGVIRFPEHEELNTTLAEMFEKAGSDTNWKNTADGQHTIFSDNSTHTLKFFYLERGNQYSNCNITFNLQEPILDHIRKVDENGAPLSGATFELYAATTNSTFDNSRSWHTADEFDKLGAPITTATSNDNGYATLATESGSALSYENSEYYILEETGTPAGYLKSQPIVLKYHRVTGTLTVVNKYETGAYASFLADWAQTGGQVGFADYVNGTFIINGDEIDTTIRSEADVLRYGLAIMVPVVRIGDQWLPLYGSNTFGWTTVKPADNDQASLINALAEAVIMQASDPITRDWYLRWDETEKRLKGHIDNLPGDATRYDNGGDIELATLFLPQEALTALGLTNNTVEDDDARYAELRRALEGQISDEKDAKRLADNLSELDILKIIYTGNFDKNSKTVIYVPNEQRELRVRKEDENGKPMENAVFALFDSVEHAAAGTSVTSDGVLAYGATGKNGGLIFRANGLTGGEADFGYAQMNWNSSGTDNNTAAVYWLKEITAPIGYELNKSLIRIEVGNAGIYANATGFDANGKLLEGAAASNDGIMVEASLGSLTQTLVKYAEGIVDETLMYITATKQTAKDNGGALDINSWFDAVNEAESKLLTYNIADGYESAIFETESGFIRVMPRQTTGIAASPAKRDNLTNNGVPIDLNGLFGLINTVVVTDAPAAETGSLTVSKTVRDPRGGEIDADAEFVFTVTLSDKTFESVYGTAADKLITFTAGSARFTLRHGESVTFTGLPAGVAYEVAEAETEDYKSEATGASGKIVEGNTAKAEFINTKTDKEKPQEAPDYNPDTGIDIRLCFWVIALTLSVVFSAGTSRKHGKYQ